MNIHLLSRKIRPGTRRRLAGAFGLLLTLGLLVTLISPAAVMAVVTPPPAGPDNFYGTVKINGVQAPENTLVEAYVGGMLAASQMIGTDGLYGDPDGYTFVVSLGEAGATVTFKVNGTVAATSTRVGLATIEVNLDAAITPGPYTLTVTSTGCCTIAVVNTTTATSLGTVSAGATQEYTVEADEVVRVTANGTACCSVTNWVVDAGAPTAANPLDITMNMNHTAVATCTVLGPYMLGILSDPVAGGTVSGGGSYACGTTVTVTANPADGYKFVEWSGDLTGSANPSTIVMNGTKNIVAHFEELPPFVNPGAIMSLPLVENWNTFSTPITLATEEDTWGELVDINGIGADVAIVYSFDPVAYQWVQMGDDDPVMPLVGYYIKMYAAGNIEIVPSDDASAPPTMTLEPGLNLIGLASLTDRPVTEFLTTVYQVPGGIGYTLVLNPPVNTPNDWIGNVFVRDASPSPTMQVGKAYWVNMLNPGTLVGFTSTPLP